VNENEFCGRGNEKDSVGRGNGNGNGLYGEGMRKTKHSADKTRKTDGMRMTEHGMIAYPLPPYINK
jgi:hypothetical protein